MTPPRTSNATRDEAGVIVTFARRDTGDCITVTRPGFATTALLAALALFDPLEYRVQAISTPRMILMDLQGRKTVYVEENTRRPLLDGSTRIERQPRLSPEAAMLGRVGRIEYL